MDYMDFIEQKRIRFEPVGFDIDESEINPMLYDYQTILVKWSLALGRSAQFLDCGMGKTFTQLEWAKHVSEHTGKPVIGFAPLAVSRQTAEEGEKLGINVTICKTADDVRPGINITNYDRLHHFEGLEFGGIFLDESSILKGQFSAIRKNLRDFSEHINYRLCCTATPAPNDLVEIINHAEFLGIMSEAEIKALYFTQDGNSSNKFRLKRHAVEEFWRWVSTWAVAARNPSDMGFSDVGHEVPPMKIEEIVVELDEWQTNTLFSVDALSLSEQRKNDKLSLDDRVAAVADLVNNDSEPWVVWCNTNAESAALTKAIPDAVEIKGSDKAEHKESSLLGFSHGKIRVLVTKSSIAGFGMNWQHCNRAAFFVNHSYEQFYQAVRRIWRHGQKREVTAYMITNNGNRHIIENIKRKENQMDEMFEKIIFQMDSHEFRNRQTEKSEAEYLEASEGTDRWTLYLGDSVKTMDNIESDSVGLSVFSPPFPGMYVYTNSPHDMGNVKNIDEMIDQFKYLMDEEHLYRVLMPGRSTFIHITQGVAQKQRDGYIGLKDFRGKIIAMMEEIGWIYYGEVTIDKDPQLKAMRTKDHGLMFKSLATDAARMHPALADTVLQFRKRGDNPEPIKAAVAEQYGNPDGWVTNYEWINWARPVWYSADYMPGTWRPDHNGDPCPDGIRETDVLNVSQARETNDERHLCPLQIGVIERIVRVWSNPDDVVYSPFAGIGSEGYVSIKNGRRFIGGELKEGYWRQAIRNLRSLEAKENQMTLFDLAAD